MSPRLTLSIVSDIHYAGAEEQARGAFSLDSIKHPARRLAESHVPQDALALPDHVVRRDASDGEHPADGRGRREGASRAENLTTADLRHIVDPADVAEANALAARLARTMRARLVRRTQVRRRGKRLDLRRTIHRNVSHGGTPIDPLPFLRRWDSWS